MQRRQFLGWGVGAVGALAAGGFYYGRNLGSAKAPFANPKSPLAAGDLVEAALDVTSGPVNLGGRVVPTYTFNGRFPGPAISAKQGDTVRIVLNNRLSEPTNLHFHGLHIPPTGVADNIFLEVQPGESQRYEFVVPKDHPAGMYWYHPHLHGRAAKQVSMGLAAPFIVRGDLDRIPEVASAQEHVLVLQDLPSAGSGMMSMGMHSHGSGESPILVNGQLNPTLAIAQNGLVRLRFLNASISRYYRLKIEEHPMHIIATDGGGIPTPQSVDELLLMPGQRTDVLVRGERSEGSFQILSSISIGAADEDGEMSADNSQSLASLAYAEKSTQTWSVPSRLIDVPLLSTPSRSLRSFVLAGSDMMSGGGMGAGRMGGGMMGGGMMGSGFSINGRRFDANRIDTSVPLDTIEDWEYVNTSGMDHPMHLHTNPFQVLDSDGRPEPAWRDMVNVPARRRVRVRVSFKDFAGITVQHCHILTHEDAGMMATVQMTAANLGSN